MQIAEVIQTSIAFKKSKDKNDNDLPLGAIRVRFGSGVGGPREEKFAFPISNIMTVPLLGEHVLMIKGPSDFTNPGFSSEVYYYITPFQLQGNKHLNPLPGAFNIDKAGEDSSRYAAHSAAKVDKQDDYKPGENFIEQDTVKNLQPFEGDILLEGRHGQGIRLSSGIGGSKGQYDNPPFWDGKQGSPITIISNGHRPITGPNKYVIESPNDNSATIILSSKSQTITLEPSQTNLGLGFKAIASYKEPQAIITSDRVHLNAKEDAVILSAKKDVVISTPNWAMKLDELYTEIEKLLQIQIDLASGKLVYATPAGPTGPSTALANLNKIKSKLDQMKQ